MAEVQYYKAKASAYFGQNAPSTFNYTLGFLPLPVLTDKLSFVDYFLFEGFPVCPTLDLDVVASDGHRPQGRLPGEDVTAAEVLFDGDIARRAWLRSWKNGKAESNGTAELNGTAKLNGINKSHLKVRAQKTWYFHTVARNNEKL